MAEEAAIRQEFQSKRRVQKAMLWIGILSMIMLFAGLTSAYIVRQAEGQWLYFELPTTFYISTAMIVLSSVTLLPLVRFAKRDNHNGIMLSLGLTMILGLLFTYFQFQAWGEMVDLGIFFAGSQSNAAGSYLYVITGVHLAHLAGGLITLLFTLIKASLKRYDSANYTGLELTATYWHFLDILWIYLLMFLMYIR